MKHLLLASTALVLLAGVSNAGGLRGSYASIEAGTTWFHPEQVTQTTTFVGTPTSDYGIYGTEFSAGWAVLGSVGYAFDSGVRAELEAGYRRNDLNKLVDRLTGSSATLPAEGDFSSFTIMANALYDLPVSDQMTLSFGLGVGVERAELSIVHLGFEDANWQVAYQALAGVNFNLSNRSQLFLNYRYLQTERPEYPWHLDPVTNGNQLTSFLQDLNRHTVTVGLRYALASPGTR